MKLGYLIVFVSLLLSSLAFSTDAVAQSVWDKETELYSEPLNITVYSSPSCNCCEGWMKHLTKHGFQIKSVKTEEMEAIKQKYNLPSKLASCHTAIINGYVIEGHVPADDIKRFLKQKPNLLGLSVPEMPIGTPGMDTGNQKEPFEVVSFSKTGTSTTFRQYKSY
ncbi:DUF411 domain-containing protein [Chroococcus sp. FPU101]|uniref:DUF411 domain-containing protein n=1 Tax=Chroococcus sp. FPU101 TaxID=1974212 RepID=UPI001A8D85D3|nr:DUF411 domain-containing protein [Chroococcus sp. FPU101]GFE68969.1 hypothetical protein CFPU101_15790 [Chroococcus sp. FPU101]